MILDALEYWRDYLWPSERFHAGFEYLQKLDIQASEGRHSIDGDNVYCMVQKYETTRREGHEFEAHREYADIQMLLAGEERILWAPVNTLTVTKPYKPDIEFQALIPNPTELVLRPGVFCVFFPRDAHAPCIAHIAPSPVQKAVVKVRIA